MHMHFPGYSYTFNRSSNSLDLHIQISGYLLLIRYMERITYILRSRSPSLLNYQYFLSLLYSIAFMILCIGLMLIPFPFHVSSCVDVYM